MEICRRQNDTAFRPLGRVDSGVYAGGQVVSHAVVYTAQSSACGHGSSQWHFGMRWETLRKEAEIRKGEASIWIASALNILGFGTRKENLKRRAISKFRAAQMAQWEKYLLRTLDLIEDLSSIP